MTKRHPIARHRLVRVFGLFAFVLAFVAHASGRFTAQERQSAAEPNVSGTWTLENHLELVRTIRAHIGIKADWRPSRTAWGQPDMTGAWTSDSVHGVPRDRPAQFGRRMFLTEDEFAQREKAEAATRVQASQAVGFGNSAGRDRQWRGDITFRLTSQIVAPQDGRTPAFTPEAQKRRATRDRGSFGSGPFDTPEDFTLYDRCVTRGIVGSVLPVNYGNGNTILQTPDSFVVAYEMIHDTRIIPVDGRASLSPNVRQYLGDSRGRWQGDTLIVETTNLTDKTSIGPNGNGLRHSESMRLVEHFTVIADGALLYDVTIDDPKTYTQPWTIAVPLVSTPGFQTLPYECHEGNNVVAGALGGDRKYEADVAEALAKGLPPPPRSPSDNGDVFREGR
jgi:hypothetical protein